MTKVIFSYLPAFCLGENMEEATKIFIKALGDWEIELLGVPYGSEQERDTDGEYFTPETKLHEDKYGLPPAVHYHGLSKDKRQTKPEYIGRTLSYEDKADGRWYRVALDKGNEYARQVWEAVQKGTAAVSSGASHLARVAANGMIAEWPVTELSIWDNATGTNPQANPKAIAMPAKYQVIEQQPENEKETVSVADEQINTDLPIIKSSKETIMNEQDEVKKDKVVAVDVAAIAKQAAQEAVKAYQDALPVKSAGVAVIGDEADRKLEGNPYKSPADFYESVIKATVKRETDERLLPLRGEIAGEGVMYELPKAAIKAIKAPSGLSEVVPADGGFLVASQRQEGVMLRDYATGEVWNRARNIPIGANSNGLTMNALDETSRAAGSRWGGVLGYWLAEADLKTATKPAFRQIEAKLKKVAALVYATDELLADATALAGVINSIVPAELAFQKDDAAINGSGVGKPLGILNSPALVTVAKEAGQAADTVVAQNIINMWARRWARGRYVWFINQDVEPQLHALNLPVGTGGALVYMPPGGLSGLPYGTLYGSPVITIEQASTVGDVGDIILADMMEYLTISKGGVQSAESIHVRFIYDESVFRFVERVDGMPTWDSPLTPFKGSNTQSPFVALAARA